MGDVVPMTRGRGATWVVPGRIYFHKLTGAEVSVTSIEFRPTGGVLIRFRHLDDLQSYRLWATEFEESYRS